MTTTAHPIIARAQEHLARCKAEKAELEERLLDGSPIGPEQLAEAAAKVNHAELLVERAKREALADDENSARAGEVSAAVRDAVAELGDGVGELDHHVEAVTSAVADLVAAASQRSAAVRELAGTVDTVDDPQRHGLFTRVSISDPVFVRTPEAVVVDTDPAVLLGAALAPVVEHDARLAEQLGPLVAAGVRGMERLAEQVDAGPYEGPLLSAVEREQRRLDEIAERRRLAVEEATERQAEAIERAKSEGFRG